MNNTPQVNISRVSIITPSLNQAEFLEETIISVINQNYPLLEYMVIDGGSQDGSVDIIKKYSNYLSYWVSENDRGQAHAINKGLRRATGEYISWINSDDTLTPGAINRVIAFLSTNPEISLAYGSIYYIDRNGRRIGSATPTPGTPIFSPQTMIGDRVIVQPGSFWRRIAMEKVGLLNESYHHIFDYEFWTRILLSKGLFAQVPGEPLANFRLSSGSKTVSNIHKSGQEELRLLPILLSDPRLFSLNIPHHKFQRQLRKAYGIAYMKMFKGCSQQPGQQISAWKYLITAIQYYPIFLITRFPLMLSVARDQFHQL